MSHHCQPSFFRLFIPILVAMFAFSGIVPGPGRLLAQEMPRELSTQSESGTEAPAPVVATATTTAPQQLKSPQQLLKYILEANENRSYKRAVPAFDFEDFPELTPLEKEDYVFRFAAILRRLDNLNIADVPDSPKENVCQLHPDPAYGGIILQRSADGIWKISRETVAEIPTWYDQIRNKPPVMEHSILTDYLPAWFFQQIDGMMVIHCMVILFFLIAGYVAKRIFPIVISRIIGMIFGEQSQSEYAKLLDRALKPLAWFIMYAIWMIIFCFIPVKPSILNAAMFLLRLLSILQISLTLYLMVDIFRIWLNNHWINSANKVKHALVDLLVGMVKILVVCTGFIAIVQVLGYSPLGVISGLGIGGIAVALAAQQTISNFFGSLTILMDQPFGIGDYIISGSVEGTVESVGLRSTRLRTPANSLICIPNSLLSGTTIDNLGLRFSRRFKTTIGLQYDTPVPLFRAFCAGIRKLILETPRTKKDDVRVYVNNFSSSSIDIELVCFFMVPDIHAENAQREQLILEIVDLAKELGVSFAFPTQTNYLITSEDLTYPAAWKISDGERSKAFGEQCASTVLDRRRKSEPPSGRNIPSGP